MKIDELIITNKEIAISKQIEEICYEGLDIMQASKDPSMHGIDHIERLFDYLYEFAKTEEFTKLKINWEVLLPAICWHDTWRSSRTATNIFKILYHTYNDGLGSAKLFQREANIVGLDKNLIKQITYAIKKHASFQILPLKSVEAKILADMDNLDVWSEVRLKAAKVELLEKAKKSRMLQQVGKFVFKLYFEKVKESDFYYNFAKSRFIKLRPKIMTEIGKVASELNYKL